MDVCVCMAFWVPTVMELCVNFWFGCLHHFHFADPRFILKWRISSSRDLAFVWLLCSKCTMYVSDFRTGNVFRVTF